jgi:hypothetical protein
MTASGDWRVATIRRDFDVLVGRLHAPNTAATK